MTNQNAIKRYYKSELKKRYGALNSDKKFYLVPWLSYLINKISELIILGLNQYHNFRNKKKIVKKASSAVLTVKGKTIKTGNDSSN